MQIDTDGQNRKAWDKGHLEKPLGSAADDLVRGFVERLPRGASLLDAGCGRARNSFAFAEAGFKVCGCDFSSTALGVARGRVMLQGGGPNFVLSDLTDLAFFDNHFKGILCTRVLPYLYLSGIQRALSELKRVLSEGGWLYFDLLACDDAEYGCGPELEPGTFLDPDGLPIHFSTRQEITTMTVDFDELQIKPIKLGSPDRLRAVWTVWAKK